MDSTQVYTADGRLAALSRSSRAIYTRHLYGIAIILTMASISWEVTLLGLQM